MTRSILRLRCSAMLALALAATPTFAQDRGPDFLGNLFNRGEQQQAQPDSGGSAEMSTRLDRIENVLRQLTGNIEELQHRNQLLEQQVRELQQRAGLATAPGAVAMPPSGVAPPMNSSIPGAPPATPGGRSDVFDPARQPNAPGAPRPLGGGSSGGLSTGPREAGAPLDLSTLSNTPPAPPGSPNTFASTQSGIPAAAPRTPPAPSGQLATLPPSASPQDEFDLAYGYVLHRDYGLAVQAFRDFLRKYPQERLVPDAQFWLGDALFRQQQYREAAEAFLAVSTKYEHSGKAPDALLKLGQSLAELHQKEAACATLAQVGRKYPKASASVKRGAAQELKKQRC